MAELDGSLLVVHRDRKAQRLLQRVLGATGRQVHVVEDADAATEALRDGTPAVLVVGSAARLEPGCDDIVDLALAAGCHACVVVHDDRGDVPPELFRCGAFQHLVTAAMPVLAEELFATMQKLLRGDVFGLDKYLAWGAVHGQAEVVATDDRLRALRQLSEDAERMSIGRRQVAAVMLAADELILNAIYNAPVDERGAHYLRGVPRDTVRNLSARERPQVRWACDGRWFALSVRDAFGSLEPSVLVEHLSKSLARSAQIRSDGPGAGIGLAMTYTAVTQLVFDVDPDRATEAIALVDVRPWPPAALPPRGSFHLFVGGDARRPR